MRVMVPICDTEENQRTGPVMNPGLVPSLNPDSSIRETIEAFLSARIPNPKTARGYRRNLLAAFGSMCLERPSEIQSIHLVTWLGELNRDGRGDAPHAAALIAVRSFLKWVGAMGGHDLRMDLVFYLLPVPNVQVIKPHNSLTQKEVGKLLAAGKRGGPRDFALILVALGAGLRVSELVHVDVTDVLDDAGGGTVILVRQGKGSKDRLMPVRKEVRQGIEAYLAASHRGMGDGGPLFMSQDHALSSRESWRLSTKTATKIIKTSVALAGIEKRVTPHALRHTFAFASYLYSNNIVAVQHLLGHATVATTMRYVAHLDKLQLRSAIPAYLGGGKGPRVKPSAKK